MRIRGVAPPLGRRCIQFSSDGIGQSRLTLRVSVCDGHIIHTNARWVRRCSRVTPGQGGLDKWPALESRAWPPHSTPLWRTVRGPVRQGNRQADNAKDRGLQATMRGQEHWVHQGEAALHPGYLWLSRIKRGYYNIMGDGIWRKRHL